MPTQIMEIKDISLSNQQAGENQERFFFFVGRDRMDNEHEFCISWNQMMKFHLDCFQHLYSGLSDLDADLAEKLQRFRDAYQILVELGPEISHRIEHLQKQC